MKLDVSGEKCFDERIVNKYWTGLKSRLGRSTLILLFGVVLAVGLGVVMNLIIGQPTMEAAVQASIERHLVTVESGAHIVGSFFDLTFKGVEGEARSLHRVNADEETRSKLKEFVELWRGTPMVGVLLVDREGVVVMGVNIADSDPLVGTSVADRDYFQALKDGKSVAGVVGGVVVSRAGASKDKYIVPMAAPIYSEKGEFVGILASAVVLEDLSKELLKPFSTVEGTEIYLLKRDGTVMVAPETVEEMLVGKNVYDIIGEKNFPGDKAVADGVRKGLEGTGSGVARMILPKTEGGLLEKRFITYAPVVLGGKASVCDCILALAVPEVKVLETVGPVYTRSVLVVLVVSLVWLGIAIRIAKKMGYEEAAGKS